MDYDRYTMSASKNVVQSLREVVQDLLVPELKAVKVSVEGLRQETKTSNDVLRQEIKISLDALRQEIKLRDEMQMQAMKTLSEKLDFAIDVRERPAVLEARLPRQ